MILTQTDFEDYLRSLMTGKKKKVSLKHDVIPIRRDNKQKKTESDYNVSEMQPLKIKGFTKKIDKKSKSSDSRLDRFMKQIDAQLTSTKQLLMGSLGDNTINRREWTNLLSKVRSTIELLENTVTTVQGKNGVVNMKRIIEDLTYLRQDIRAQISKGEYSEKSFNEFNGRYYAEYAKIKNNLKKEAFIGIEEFMDGIEKNEDVIRELEKKISDLENQIKLGSAQMNKNNEVLTNLTDKIKNLEHKKSELEKELLKSEKSALDSENKLNINNSKLQDTMREIKEKNTTISEKETLLKTKEKQIFDLEARIKAFEESRDISQKSSKEPSGRIIFNESDNEDEDIEQLKEDYEKLNMEYEELENELLAKDQEKINLLDEIESYQRKIEELKKENARLVNEINRLGGEAELYKEQIQMISEGNPEPRQKNEPIIEEKKIEENKEITEFPEYFNLWPELYTKNGAKVMAKMMSDKLSKLKNDVEKGAVINQHVEAVLEGLRNGVLVDKEKVGRTSAIYCKTFGLDYIEKNYASITNQNLKIAVTKFLKDNGRLK